jgi:hypothetical protein
MGWVKFVSGKRKVFFFEKKKQKTFALTPLSLGRFIAGTGAETKGQKFFGSFFQKRTYLP